MTQATRSKRTVATRVLGSYAIIMIAFALAAGWSVVAQRNAAREARLVRTGYFPLAFSVHDLVAKQDTWNTQLNHITAARNPADIRIWFDFALRIGRPRLFGEVRAAISRAFLNPDELGARAAGTDLLGEVANIETLLAGDSSLLDRLFEAIDRRDEAGAERLRDELVTRGSQGSKQLNLLEQHALRNVDLLLERARDRELLAIRFFVALAVGTALVGGAMALYARRVLRPLAWVTERAKAVASGDLKPREAVISRDEIGELSTTFEGMVSAIARANEQLLASERLATIGKMAAHVTHEIRNPLSSIALNVELLEDDLAAGTEEPRALVRAIRLEVERLTALSEQYLSVARRQPLRPEREDLREVVSEALEFMRRDLERHSVRLELVSPAEPVIASIDEAQIKQALFNLIRNAREAMPKGGALYVTVKAGEGGGADVTVEDEGVGLDAAARARLFEPFFTTKSHGTGLGLAITRQIVEAHGGSIACEPREPKGTRIWIHLPQAALETEL
ncbi:MAG TPA: HAMP domain-containing sensor histidine kinase [Polyangiaceae bacterium]|jgi:signal transduction histidine kinase